MKRLLLILFVIVPLWTFAAGAVQAAGADGETIRWSQVKSGTYAPLHPYTLNWSGDVLDKGGLSLSTMKAASSKEADIVINQYGAMGAAGILKLSGEELREATSAAMSGMTNSVTLEKDAVYLILLHDGKAAKLRVDQMSASKVTFSYVTEEGRDSAAREASPSPSREQQGETASANPAPSAQPAPSTPSAQPAPSASAQAGNSGEQAAGQPAAASPGQQSSLPSGTTQPWSETYEVPGVSHNGPLSIYLRLDSKSAAVYAKNGKRTDYELHTAPFLHEGRTMVPVRFISEALGAKVSWREQDQTIGIVSEAAIIALQLNNNQAKVNDKWYELEVPPFVSGESTVVPLRFVGEHLSMFVYFDEGSILITDTERSSFVGSFGGGADRADAVQPAYPNESDLGTPPRTSDEPSDVSALLGKWELWIPGGFAPIATTIHGDGSQSVTNAYTPGAAGDWIDIRADGTYEWLDLGKTYKGSWKAVGPNLIGLLSGPMDSDWTMRKEGEGEAKIFAWGLEYKASKAAQ